MILVDTSVWIDFFRRGSAATRLAVALEAGDVWTHPFVVGELALGSLGRHRRQILADVRLLPLLPVLADAEVHELIEARSLAGSGVGWVDAHLLGCALAAGAALWTLDRRLARVAASLAVS